MEGRVRDLMKTNVRCVSSHTSLAELERAFLAEQVGAFPVMQDGRLVGIVSRSDIVRQLGVEQTLAENVADASHEMSGFEPELESAENVAEQIGQRLEGLHVHDVMIRTVATASPDQTLAQAARLMMTRHVHHLPVVEEGRVVGIVAALDFVRLFAEEKVRWA